MSDGAYNTTFTVYVTMAVFNFASSIIQGVAGIGDAILMQVLWLLACNLSPQFLETPLGDSPVRAVALIMYIRLLFMSPLVVYLGINDSVFSKQMTTMMAIPSTVLTIVGVLLYTSLDTASLKKILGMTCFLFALVYVGIIIYRTWRKARQVAELRGRNVKLVVEADALAQEAQLSRNTSMANLHASFVQNVPNNSIFATHAPPGLPPMPLIISQNTLSASATTEAPPPPTASVMLPGSTIIPQNITGSEVDARTGLPADTTEAYLSTIGGDVFVGPETQAPHVNEENVPPLTPSKISPSRTMTYTRVRINRNIDANGKIKMSTKIGAAVAASVAGLMASLTGVNAPPQIIFILLFDAPNYIVRVNFSAQSIPSNVVRFFMAVWNGSFNWAMLPLMIVVVVFGFAGVFVGNRVGRLLGPQSFNIFVLCLLLLCSLAMVGKWQSLLIISCILTAVITVTSGYLENKRNKPVIEKQRQSELEVEKRLYDCLEELQRNNNSFVHSSTFAPISNNLEHLQRTTRPKPMWGGGANFDNDDEGANDETLTDEARGGRGAGPHQHRHSRHSLVSQLATSAPPAAASAAVKLADDEDEHTTPAVRHPSDSRATSSSSSDRSDRDKETRKPLPSSNCTLPHERSEHSVNDQPLPHHQSHQDRPSPSLHSLSSNTNMPSDDDTARKR